MSDPCREILESGATSKSACVVTLTLILAIVAGCSGGGGGSSFSPLDDSGSGGQDVELNYDSDNNFAPNLTGATYEAAARFTPTQTAGLVGEELVEVRFYIDTPPSQCQVKVYSDGTASEPGPLLYAADVTGSVGADGWNVHTLQVPVTIPSGDLWISVAFTHAGFQQTIGCDPGPAVPDGDWLYASTDDDWIPFNQRVASSVNWNIRGIVELSP